MDCSGFETLRAEETFSSPAPVHMGPAAHPAWRRICNESLFFSDVKQPGRGVDNPPILAPGLNMARVLPLLPHKACIGLLQGDFAYFPKHGYIIYTGCACVCVCIIYNVSWSVCKFIRQRVTSVGILH